ncbi:MAG: hypothetical protein JRJ60_01555 [Deltaproteobacteria bacterium]|nr:hypothetical protein [Deltaproteobacteria bacterium]
MRDQSGDIIWHTVLNTTVPFLMGVGVMLALGYGWLLAFVIGLTRMPTAEAVIVPILNVGYARFASETSQMQENTFQTEAHRYMIRTLVLITI